MGEGVPDSLIQRNNSMCDGLVVRMHMAHEISLVQLVYRVRRMIHNF